MVEPEVSLESQMQAELTNQLQEQKLNEEITSLRAERGNKKVTLYLEIIKAAVLGVAALIAFWVVTQPESLLNRAASKETIARERAKLLLDALKEPDLEKRLASLRIIRVAYGTEDVGWLNDMEKELREKVKDEEAAQYLKRLEALRAKYEALAEEEANGKGPSKRPGLGPIYVMLRHEQEAVQAEIDSTNLKLKALREPSK